MARPQVDRPRALAVGTPAALVPVVLAAFEKAEMAVEATVDRKVGGGARAPVPAAHLAPSAARQPKTCSHKWSEAGGRPPFPDERRRVSRELELLREHREAQVDA